MKERPILMNGEMVRAVLDGRKTQTRRVGKFQSDNYTELDAESICHATLGEEIQATYRAFPGAGTARWAICGCPYGKPGDRLWVRETTAMDSEDGYIIYKADGMDISASIDGRWTPAIHMPRAASRITLEITDVRVQRVNEISEEDAKAEGCRWAIKGLGYEYFHTRSVDCPEDEKLATYRAGFEELWDSINAERGFGWDVNPWVWAISFRRIKP